MAEPVDDPARRLAYGDGIAAIREAALAVASERGLASITLRAVADRAGVSHSLVRHHFGTRERLVAEVVAAAIDRTSYLGATMDEPLSTRYDRTLGELRIQYEMLLDDARSETLANAYVGYRGEVVEWLGARGVDADPSLVDLVVAVVDGLALQRLSRGGEADVDAAFAVLAAMVDSRTKTAAPRDEYAAPTS